MENTKKENVPAQNSDKDKTPDQKASDTEKDFFKKLPPEAKKVVEFGLSMQRVGPIPDPIMDKITEKHIDKILEIAERDEERSFQDAKESRRYNLIYFLILSLLFVFCTIFLVKTDKELYRETLKLFVAFVGGFGGGFGFKSYMDKKKK